MSPFERGWRGNNGMQRAVLRAAADAEVVRPLAHHSRRGTECLLRR